MSAEVLRRAAALMRERAQYADEGPWTRRGSECQCCDDLHNRGGYQIAQGVDVINADHIASWHPHVALAVANWLDFAATGREALDLIAAHNGRPLNNEGSELFRDMEERALAVARAYLGSES